MAMVYIPALMQDLTGGREKIEVNIPAGETRTVRQILAELEKMHPGMEERLLEEGNLTPGLAVFIDGEQAGLALSAKVQPGNELFFLAPMAGG